ncbi:MgtC/SapB family protein [Caldimonas sp. KR1-144]|uniref:MgtC/SapB family protein n=1 Tax=Caldimonas sp. KR1-144 TaxID=3400911 RepID=UPI003C10A1AE
MDLDVARNFLVALLIGALVGAQREMTKPTDGSEPRRPVGGIRTFMLVALVGAASAWLARAHELPWTFATALGAVGLVMALRRGAMHAAPNGITSEIAAIAVCLLGALAAIGDTAIAVALAVAVSAVLAFKQPLHGLVGRMDEQDMYAGIKLLAATFIVLPLLPNAPIDPWGALNPYELWLLVVLISALSLVGYVATRWLGPVRGAALGGITGGLVSSTAATLSFARASRDETLVARDGALGAGILLAWLVMFLRITLLVAALNLPLLERVWPALALMGGATAVFAALHYRSGLAKQPPAALMSVSNPFSLSAAMRFAALFALVLLVVHVAQARWPGAGTYVVAGLTGLVDTDAISLSLASGAKTPEARATAATALVIAMIANTATKCLLVLVLGRGALRRQIAVAAATTIAMGVLALSAAPA